MTVHAVRRDDASVPSCARVGFVVGRAVGNAVQRHRTQRRLRHVMRAHLHRLPERTDLVIRAHPGAAAAPSTELDAELGRLLPRALRGLAPSRADH